MTHILHPPYVLHIIYNLTGLYMLCVYNTSTVCTLYYNIYIIIVCNTYTLCTLYNNNIIYTNYTPHILYNTLFYIIMTNRIVIIRTSLYLIFRHVEER